MTEGKNEEETLNSQRLLYSIIYILNSFFILSNVAKGRF